MAVLYSKAFGGLHLLLRAYGSAIPRTLLASLLSAALAVLLYYVPGRDYFEGLWRHPYPYQLFAFLVGFILVLRSNLGYSRYWEGRSQLQLMSAYWFDVVVKALVFEATSDASRSAAAEDKEAGLSAAHAPPPAPPAQPPHPLSANHHPAGFVAARLHGSQYKDPVLSWDGGSAAPPQQPPPELQAFADLVLHLASLLHALCMQHLRHDRCLANLQVHTPGSPPPPADARGLPNYRVGWLQLLTLRAGAEQRMRYHRAMQLPVLGGLTRGERLALGEPREQAGGAETETLLTGLDQAFLQHPGDTHGVMERLGQRLEVETGLAVEGANVRATSAYTRLHMLLASSINRWEVAPPTTAVLGSLLSQGWASFEACRKLAESPFPFPWAQMVALLLVLYSVTLPAMMCGWLNELWLVVVMTFISVLTYWSLNEVARDLEDCFLYDPNDAPLARLQWEFNQRLLAAAQAVGARGGRAAPPATAARS